jgi:hypothetical protein
MPIKLNHYGAKTVDDVPRVDFDAIATEILVFVVCGGFAYMGWKGGMVFLLISNTLIAFICVGSLLFRVVKAFHGKLKNKENAKHEK